MGCQLAVLAEQYGRRAEAQPRSYGRDQFHILKCGVLAEM